ncbi:hypothetical protein [Actinoplanes sp. NPDC048796]|uniref:hypothetical protein n=1 Tax=unclassified Actinoplanes TaxID=2626549 RepID=UPI0033F10E44
MRRQFAAAARTDDDRRPGTVPPVDHGASGRARPRRKLAEPARRGEAAFDEIRGDLLARLAGVYLVGHNIGVDWRMLHWHLPELSVAGLIDTHRLAKPPT